jgi:hypothetical protein
MSEFLAAFCHERYRRRSAPSDARAGGENLTAVSCDERSDTDSHGPRCSARPSAQRSPSASTRRRPSTWRRLRGARAYFSDLRSWWSWCATADVHPLTARRHHVDELYVGERTSGPIFLNADGPERLSYSTSCALIHRLATRAGIAAAARISPHSLRHSFATELLANGVPLQDVQDAMPHARPRTTRAYDRSRHNLAWSTATRLRSCSADRGCSWLASVSRCVSFETGATPGAQLTVPVSCDEDAICASRRVVPTSLRPSAYAPR